MGLLGSDGVTAVSHFVVLPRAVVGRFEVYDRRGWSIRFLRAKVFRSYSSFLIPYRSILHVL